MAAETLIVKILGTKPHLRYSVRRVVQSACQVLRKEQPELEFTIIEVKDSQSIFHYTPVLVAPALVINEKLVHAQWIPTREQVVGWLQAAIEEQRRTLPDKEGSRNEKEHSAHLER